MLAYFTQETVLPPLGLVSIGSRGRGTNGSQFEVQRLKDASGLEAKFVDLGMGNGMSCLDGPGCVHSSQDHISCLFAGEKTHWPVLEQLFSRSTDYISEGGEKMPQSAAAWIASLLLACEGEQLSCTGTLPNPALDIISKLDGPFAFVVYDAANHRVLAGRDKAGKQELFWGVTSDGHLLFSTSVQALEDCNPTATAFPAGSVFVSANKAKASQPGSQGWTIDSRRVPGNLHSFVKSSRPPRHNSKPADSTFKSVRAVPRVNSQGCLCGAVYRVSSDHNLADWGASF